MAGSPPDEFVIVTQDPIGEALACKRRTGNKMTWYSTANSRFGSTVYRTWHTNGRGTEQLGHAFALIDLLPCGRQEEWQDSPGCWPQPPACSRRASSGGIAALYGPDA